MKLKYYIVVFGRFIGNSIKCLGCSQTFDNIDWAHISKVRLSERSAQTMFAVYKSGWEFDANRLIMRIFFQLINVKHFLASEKEEQSSWIDYII